MLGLVWHAVAGNAFKTKVIKPGMRIESINGKAVAGLSKDGIIQRIMASHLKCQLGLVGGGMFLV